jgi:hypothetical protein
LVCADDPAEDAGGEVADLLGMAVGKEGNEAADNGEGNVGAVTSPQIGGRAAARYNP